MRIMNDHDRLPPRIRRALTECVLQESAYDFDGFVRRGLSQGLSEEDIIRKIQTEDSRRAKMRYLRRGFDFIPNPL